MKELPSIITGLNINGIAHVATKRSTRAVSGWRVESKTWVTHEWLLPTNIRIRFPLKFCRSPNVDTPSGRSVCTIVLSD